MVARAGDGAAIQSREEDLLDVERPSQSSSDHAGGCLVIAIALLTISLPIAGF